MNYSDLNSEIDNKSSLSSIQGQEYRKKYDLITKEGFSNLFGENAVDSKNKSDLNELLELEKKYQSLLSEYLNDYKQLMSNTTQYFDILKSPLINKNIRLTDGTIGYVTNVGVFKPYPSMDIFNNTSGKNGCPSNFTQVEAIISNNKVTTTPPFTVGEKMELEQSCGNEGKNVFVSSLGQEGSHSYQGCFNGGDGIEVGNRDQLEQGGSFEQCKNLAQIRGKNVFGLNSVENKAMCYIGDDIEKIRSNGLSLKNIVSWETPINTSAISAALNKTGQLLVKGYVNAVSNIIPGLTFQVYQGYMNDNVNFFKTATKLGSRGVTNSDFNDIRGSTNSIINENSQKVSVEWIGYVQMPSYEFDSVRFELESDDCSFMWIGNEAISNYTISNAFINNAGTHPMKKVSKSIVLKSNTYYPIRIQYGNNEGQGNIKIWQYITSGKQTSGGVLRGNTTPDPFSSELILPNSSTIATLWKSNEPVSGCDPIYGGLINSTDTVATWGYNCNSKNFKGTPYNVPIGNVTDGVKSVIEKNWSASYLVGGSGNDPAYGCRKNFSANYTCGNGVTKSINISGEAGGRTAVFNCKSETRKCQSFLRVLNDGNLVIYNLYDRSVLWNSNTVGKTGIINKDKMASKGKNGRNYLREGETLSDGEFIGSDNGKCYLQMVKGVGLQLIYNESNCTSIDGKMYGNNTSTIAAYSLTDNDRSNLFKTGYITNDSIYKPYNQSQLSQTNNYIEIGLGNKNMLTNIDNRIKEIKVNDISECKTSCNEDKNCDGFNYLNYTDKNNANIKSCGLKDKSQINPQDKYSAIYPNNNDFSIIENKLYKRINNVKNNTSCSKEVSNISNDLYSNYVKGGSFTEKDTCGLGKYNDVLKKKLNRSLSRLQLTVRQMNQKLSNLSVTDKKILTERGYNEKKINDNIMSIGLTHQKYLGSKPQFETIKGMVNDTDSDMLSKSYNSLLWSILAIMIVIGGIKMTK